MPNYTEQQFADILGISVEENTRRREQRSIDELAVAAVRVRRNRVVQTPRGSSYIDLEDTTLSGYTNSYIVSASQNRPIHADFESSYQYNVFLQSKYKHHHKCSTCQMVFRCGEPKCTRTLCKLCSLGAQTVPAPWTTGVVSLNFTGSIGSTWQNNYVTVDEAAQDSYIAVHDEIEQLTARQEYTADFEAVERRVLAGTSVLADLAPERSTEEES